MMVHSFTPNTVPSSLPFVYEETSVIEVQLFLLLIGRVISEKSQKLIELSPKDSTQFLFETQL